MAIELQAKPERKDYRTNKVYNKAKAEYDKAEAAHNRAMEYLINKKVRLKL